MLYIRLICYLYLIDGCILAMEHISTVNIATNNNFKEKINNEEFDYYYTSDEEDSTDQKYAALFNNKSQLTEFINTFTETHDISKSDLIATPKDMIAFFSQNPSFMTFIEKIHRDVETTIKDCTKHGQYDVDTIKKIQRNQMYLKKIKYITDKTPLLIEELQYYDALPLYSYYEKSLSEYSSNPILLTRLWYIYWLYLIPNTSIYQGQKKYKTYSIINQYPIENIIDKLAKNKNRFLNLFLRLNYLEKIQKSIVPGLQHLIEEKKCKEQSVSHFQPILLALNRLVNSYKKTNQTLIVVKEQKQVHYCWKAFWQDIYNQEINPKKLSESQYLCLETVNAFVKAVDERLLWAQKDSLDESSSEITDHNNDESSSSQEEEVNSQPKKQSFDSSSFFNCLLLQRLYKQKND